MKNTILDLSQTLYGMEFYKETNTVYYDGETVAELSESDTINSNGVIYYGDTKNEKLFVVLSLSEQILKDYIESMFGSDYQSFQQFLVSISGTVDLFDIIEGVTCIDELDTDDIKEIEKLEIIDDIVFYDGSNFHEINDELLSEFISEVFTEIVDYVGENSVMPCDSLM